MGNLSLDLDFNAKPKPAHVKTAGRLVAVAVQGFGKVPVGQRPDVERAVVRELCARVVGVTIPERDVIDVVPNLFDALRELVYKCRCDESRDMVAGTIEWLRRTYPTD
ncbi:MAG: hypothetical protein ABIA47_01830 [bacterium]